MTTVNNIQFNGSSNFLYKSKNVLKNLTNYTYNILPRTKNAIKIGNQEGLEIARKNNFGKLSTFLSRKYHSCKNVATSVNKYELPLIISTVTIPVTPPGFQPLLFVAGFILLTPFIIKDITSGKTSVKDIKNFLKSLSEPDFIKLNKKVYKKD